jgi:hypothetical protein
MSLGPRAEVNELLKPLRGEILSLLIIGFGINGVRLWRGSRLRSGSHKELLRIAIVEAKCVELRSM